MRLKLALLLVFCTFNTIVLSEVTNIRWCVITEPEKKKCDELANEIKAKASDFTNIAFSCVLGKGVFDCMTRMNDDRADLMTADSGLAIPAAENYQLRPVAVENYGTSNTKKDAILHYYATIVMNTKKPRTLDNMRSANVCSSGVGTADGWIMPLSKLIKLSKLPVTQCNSRVQTATAFFNSMCAPGALTAEFNPFGDNPNAACGQCYRDEKSTRPDYCTFKNLYAGSYGAMMCLNNGINDLAFTRNGEAARYAMDNGKPSSEFKLLCPDGTTAEVAPAQRLPVTSSATNTTSNATQLSTVAPKCNWGRIPSRLILTSLKKPEDIISIYRLFLSKISQLFGYGTTGAFQLFSSEKYGRKDLMFSDWTHQFYDLKKFGDERLSTVYRWLENANSGDGSVTFIGRYENLRFCPLPDVRWCVITSEEMTKCENMKLAFSARGLKPNLNCIKGGSSINCMRLIQKGFADLITLDAAELYIGGKYFNLVPIAAENYGDGTFYYAVAIVKKVNKNLLISNMKSKKTCHSGVSKATGWVIPLNLVLETGQVTVYKGKLMNAYAELVSRACVPGILSDEYNPSRHNPINLCEACTAGGNDRCQRNNRELYYGDSGAFRCLVEGGDVAFARHTTVRENTGGRNPAYWARNRRADDYELLCRDGSRRPVTEWRICNLGKIPGSTVVTAGYKTKEERTQMWKLLQYALEYFSSDGNEEFSMFDSGYGRSDLLFQDSAEMLSYIPEKDQNYKSWLGYSFLKMISTLEWMSDYSSQSGMSGFASSSNQLLSSSLLTLLTLFISFLLR